MLSNNVNISGDPARTPAQDYDFLRERGVEILKSLTGRIWNDQNIHDPGITILEQLAYAITDLAYRTSFSVPDLLFDPANPSGNMPLYSARDILSTHPVTISDYRKLIIDRVKGIRNVWLYPKDGEPYSVYNGSNAYPSNIYGDERNNTLTFTLPAIDPLTEKVHLRGLYRIKIELEDYLILSDPDDYGDFLFNDPDGLQLQKLDPKQLPIPLPAFYPEPVPYPFDITALNTAYEKKVIEVLMEHRCLCEDFDEITIIDFELIGVCADIELDANADPVRVYGEIYSVLFNYVSPSLSFYTISQLLDRGKTIEEIFEGSMVNRGFVDIDELENFDQRTEIHVSDMISLIMDIPGVSNIRKIHVSSYDSSGAIIQEGESYCLHLTDPGKKAFRFPLDLGQNYSTRLNKIALYKGTLRVPVSIDLNAPGHSIGDIVHINSYPDPVLFNNDLPVPAGRERRLQEYYSIQNEFPKAYRLGQEGIEDTATNLRKAQRLQLKGYLLFMEMLLSDYLAQLNNIKTLIKFDDIPFNQSYFFQALSADEISDLDLLIKNKNNLFNIPPATIPNPTPNDNGYYQQILEGENVEKRLDRYSRLMDKLLSVFAEKFSGYSLLKYVNSYTTGSLTQSTSSALEVGNDKKDFLRNYASVSHKRTHAFNYMDNFVEYGTTSPYATLNISGFEQRLYNILGLENPGFHFLESPVFTPPITLANNTGGITTIEQVSNVYQFTSQTSQPFDTVFGLHVVEHILLRPRQSEKEYKKYQPLDLRTQFIKACISGEDNGLSTESCFCNDPYSFRARILLPGWYPVSLDQNFRRYIETVIREEAPAHMAMGICWVNPLTMYRFEYYYIRYIAALKAYRTADADRVLDDTIRTSFTHALKDLLEVLNNLENIYPPTFLQDCDNIQFNSNGTEIISHPVILDRTNLDDSNNNYAFV